jgi:D-inositol-3-phosphate glycosyltransferase
MRLAIVGPIKPWRGGIALHTAAMAAAARARGHEVTVISYRRLYPSVLFPGRSQLEPGARSPSLDSSSGDVRPLLDSLSPLSWLRAGRELEVFRPDVVVLQRWHPFFHLALATVARRARAVGARVVWMVHNAEPHEDRAWLWRPVATAGLRGGDICLTHAASEAGRLAELGVRARTEVVRHPAPEAVVAGPGPAAARRALGIPEDSVVFLFFGYVRAYKGVDVLLDALGRLPVAGPPWCAILAGEWYVDRAAADEAIARAPLAGRVRLEDRYVADSEIAQLFAAATIVVLPYRAGTQSGVVPLAHAHGRPVLASAVGGLAEAVHDGETGRLVPPGDAQALAGALEEVRRGRRFSSAAIAGALAAAGWPAFVAVLEEIAAESRTPGCGP